MKQTFGCPSLSVSVQGIFVAPSVDPKPVR